MSAFDRRLFRSGGAVRPEEREWPSFRGAIVVLDNASEPPVDAEKLSLAAGKDVTVEVLRDGGIEAACFGELRAGGVTECATIRQHQVED